MALSTYDELVKSIINWSHRDDLDEIIPDFIALAENEFFANDVEILELRTIEKTSIAILEGPEGVQSRFIELPPRYLQQRDFRITIQDSFLGLNYQIPEALIVRTGTGTPCNFTVTNEIEFDIIPDQEYTITMKYWAKPEPLTEANQTNQILTNDPNIYLFGALHQLFLFTEDDDITLKWFNKFISAIGGSNSRAKAGRYGASPQMKVKGSTP